MPPPKEDGLVFSGYQKKLKTMKKKYFVLYKGTISKEARLEYFDSEKKFKSGLEPKKVIKLKNCFNINRRLDTKYDFVIALSTKDGGFGIVMDSEDQMKKWLEMLISLQRDSYNSTDVSQTQFEHVWQVFMQRKGLAVDKGIIGNYHVCLSSKSITLIRIGPEKLPTGDTRASPVEFLLTSIRRCGDSQCVFYIEVGRQSIVGPGELWMETEDALTAQNMHQMILSAMSNKIESSTVEPMRKRSSSANEASKPINILQRKKPELEKPNSSPQKSLYSARERCDSLPTRNRASNELANQSYSSSVLDPRKNVGLRPYSYQQRFSSSPPVSSNVGCSESEESSLSFDESDENGGFMPFRLTSRTSEGVIFEENLDELSCTTTKGSESDKMNDEDKIMQSNENYIPMAPLKLAAENTQTYDKVQTAIDAPRLVSKMESNFMEFKPEGGALKNICECDFQERPTRTYSIGSKVECNKLNKRIGSSTYENDQTRVRAFSVGSRAKIPRCELQKNVLYPRTAMESTLSSNNNIVLDADIMHYSPLQRLNSSRDKKTISAPSLIHKSHNSVEQMSDLMEIDFSKSPNYEKTSTFLSNQIVPHRNQSYVNCDQTQNNISNRIAKRSECLQINNSSAMIAPVSQTDNGYLEMKPVGGGGGNNTTTSKQTPPTYFGSSAYAKTVKNADKIISNKTLEPKTEVVSSAFSKPANKSAATVNFAIDTAREHISNHERHLNKLAQNTANKAQFLTIPQVLNRKDKNEQNTSYNLANVNKNVVKKLNELALNTSDDKELSKITTLTNTSPNHNQLNETVRQISEKKVHVPDKTGYEMLQMKSEGSLQTILTRRRSLEKENKECKSNQRPRSTNSSSVNSSAICNCTSSSTSCLNNIPLNNPAAAKPTSFPKNDENMKAQPLTNSSRPSSVNSDQELYYAKLDLPQITNDVCPKDKKITLLNDNGSNAKPMINHSYAKIDFDHSDNSSTSSKNY